ncbi:hypothetical protein AM500_14760 [Bacillus sp. FJAT-18017]|uniref:N-terminal phage integrase SAM-like domain-containing protein n=1 Tax=Bacillus sp. FJAT-18017 TaxID=1705566 RepID=UPI0006AEF079|nr:N-terminal phage integrase SAM-like domain-containing protein [Bacillus sp. FJAT-18017]ALC90900.1 hypothetical protein AM500_14760 [Bacillus sp. FJAT-18017]
MSLGAYLEYWLENYAKTNLKPKTFAEYKKIINTHLSPSLGNISLNELKTVQLAKLLQRKVKYLIGSNSDTPSSYSFQGPE